MGGYANSKTGVVVTTLAVAEAREFVLILARSGGIQLCLHTQ
jgi:hypothetical protein